MKVLVTARMAGNDLARLSLHVDEIVYAGYGATGEKLNEADFQKALEGVDIAIVEFEPFTEAVINGAKDLKIIACCRNEPGANVDLAAANELGIPVFSTPGRNAIAVAEYTIGLMIAVARNIPITHHLLRYTEELTAVTYSDKSGNRKGVTSEWSLDPGAPFQRFAGVELSGKKIGLVGLGAIGRSIARRASAFDMEILAYDPFLSLEFFASSQARSVTLEDLAREADFVVMAAKVTDESRGIFSSKMFELMKRSAYFINTARAALVDYEALYVALTQRTIAGAALDVYPVEPLPIDSLLRTLNNVVLSPHLAGASVSVPDHHGRMIVDELVAFLEREKF